MNKIDDIVIGVIHFSSYGQAFLVREGFDDDIRIDRKNTNRGFHLDTVQVKIIKINENLKYEGEVVNVLERFKDEFVGTLQITKEHSFLVVDSDKIHVDFYIPKNNLKGGTNGQKAVVKMTSWALDKKSPRGKIIEVLGDSADNDTVIHSILHEYGLPYTFPKEVIEESEDIPSEITASEIAERRDMRGALTMTIDPESAKDFDDALSVEWLDGEIVVGVHIADVSHYLKEDSVLDKEAYNRGTSVYLVDRVVPMLPERLSNGLCSLVPNEDRLCYSAVFTLSARGVIESEWFGRTVIHSDKRLSYEQAQEMIETDTDKSVEAEAVRALNRYAKILRAKRMQNDSISFDKKEVRFILDENAKPIGLTMKEMKDSNKLIEEFMLLANKRVSTLLNTKKFPMIQRSHDLPSRDKIDALSNFIKQFGYSINLTDSTAISSELNKLLSAIRGTPEESIISTLVTRTMNKAFYSTKNIGHYGLGFEHYSHFTSPIRRYPDVMAHRLLTQFLKGNTIPPVHPLEVKCVHLSEREKVAQKASRASIKFKQAEYLSERIGKVFSGVVSSVMDFGIFIEMPENGCEGLVRLSEISGDTYQADLENHCVKGYNTGDVIKLGDEVTIIIKSVDMIKKEINLSLIKM